MTQEMTRKWNRNKILQTALITIMLTLASAFGYMLYLVTIGIPATQRHIETLAR